MRKFLKYWLPTVLWAGVIFLFSARPTKSVSEFYWQDFVVKKTAHLVVYGVLAFLFYRGLINEGVAKKKAGKLAVLFCFLYGVSDEFHQSFTPGRDANLRDIVFDTIGASLAIWGIWKYLPKAPKKLVSLAEKLDLL